MHVLKLDIRGGGGGSSYLGGCVPGTGSTISGNTGMSATSTLPGNALTSAGWISGVGIGGYIFYNKRIEEAKTQAKKEVASDSKS